MTNQPEFNKQHWGEKKIADCIYELNKYNSTLSLIRCKNADYQTSFKMLRRQAIDKAISEFKVSVLNLDSIENPFEAMLEIPISTAKIESIIKARQFKPDYIATIKGGKK